MPRLHHLPSYSGDALKFANVLGNALREADIQIGGDRPWDPPVRDRAVFWSALRGDVLALGAQYVRGAWDCERVDELVARIALLDRGARHSSPIAWLSSLIQGPRLALV
jgi:hypothetical protein